MNIRSRSAFTQGRKKFVYPDAFSGFLTLKNHILQKKIQTLLVAQEAAMQSEIHLYQEVQRKKIPLHSLKISPRAQAVFDIKTEQKEDLFTTWSVSTGCYISGSSKGEPRIPDRLKPNSMCLLTERPVGCPETGRHIIGAFMVEADFFGSYCRNGILTAHPDYRLKLENDQRPE